MALIETPTTTSEPPTPLPTHVLAASHATGLFESAQIRFIPNIETAGIYISGEELPDSAGLYYRSSYDADWRQGHPLVRIQDGRLVGSLFNLDQETRYLVMVKNGTSEISGIFGTAPDELIFNPIHVIHVDDDALPGGDGSELSPYQTIQEGIDHATPGTQVLVEDGIYREAVTFPNPGEEGKWIQVKAAGEEAILDGSITLDGEWQPVERLYQVWSIRARGFIGYFARDGKRYYRYDDMSALKKSRGHNKTTVPEGFFHDMKTNWLYVRSAEDPSSHAWQAGVLDRAFYIENQSWIWIEGFEIRYYGGNGGGCGICAKNSSHVVFRKNRIHNMQIGIYTNWNGSAEQGNETRIEFNEISDPNVDEFEWDSVKGTYMEGTGIIIRGHTGAIVRGNFIHNVFNGIYTGSSADIDNPELALDADIYDNVLQNVLDDGLEPEGMCINHRFRDNRVDNMLVGMSNAPVKAGPVWVIRNLFTNFKSTSIKWSGNPRGRVYFYHNTFWSETPGLNAMSMITIAHNSTMRNNIFAGTAYAFEESLTGSSGMDWDYDNWFTKRDPAEPIFRWETIDYFSINLLCKSTGLECNGHQDPPGFMNPAMGDFRLLATSPNIDRGLLLPGIDDDYLGVAPDIGAIEFGTSP
jgi:hypothetical protein